jgi:intracellular sulfur oxidation DsrE/DsrF family protein
MEKHRVVFHIDEYNKGNLVLMNIENLLADIGERNVEVELLANAEGIAVLFKTPDLHGEQVARLAARGVRFAACANTLRQMGLTKDVLFDHVQIVPSGVGELVKKQTLGWAYIRP